MRRTLTIAALALAAVAVVWASPAEAKVDMRNIVVEGPGLASPIRLVGEDGWSLLHGNRARGLTAEEDRAVPAGEIGPRYTATVTQRSMSEFPAREVLEIYPFAEAGAWFRFEAEGWLAWMLRTDRAKKTDVWAPMNDHQLQVLLDAGLPEPEAEPPAAEGNAAEPAPPESKATATPTSQDMPWTAIVGFSVATVAWVVGRRLVSPRRARTAR
ncbi:MAG: hypothetical protein WD770_04715 [Actinomycetota bacterium]